ncbi:pilus assembly protein [Isoptericola cucumis]|uniref:TadE family protein n=1 Tax=Isoptericola cucumis TaxID=1776856 RepID=A0ABQ2B911_9MICO|nr:pilus assembly protein [Isoptericola cucumis]GGI08547.1 hypothetical protein GCM10007368_21720 [Isoptericola cucumis]
MTAPAPATGGGGEPRDTGPADPEAGAALVEFLGTAVLLLVPLVYLVLTLAQLQAGTFAVQGAAREAGRAMVTADSSSEGVARAQAAAGIALADQGFDDVAVAEALTLDCSADPCLTPGATVGVRVRVAVGLPFVPTGLRDWVPLEIPVEATQVATVDEYGQVRP